MTDYSQPEAADALSVVPDVLMFPLFTFALEAARENLLKGNLPVEVKQRERGPMWRQG